MEFFKRACLVLFAAVFTVSCADEETEPYEVKEKRSFEKWMSINVPEAIKMDNGMYYQWIDRAPADSEAPDWGDYVEINYRGLLLSDYDPGTQKSSLFMTRYREDAERLGTYTYYTHYVPQLIIHNRSYYMMQGMQEALEMMKVGDNIRLFLPSALSSTTGSALTMTYGYQGNASKPSVPVIVEMELAGIVPNPQTKEEKFVNDFAVNRWSKNLSDTVREYIYIDYTDKPVGADTVKADSTAKLYYAAFFGYDDYDKDGNPYKFLIETNIDSVAQRFNRDVSTTSYVSYKPSSKPSTPTVAGLDVISEIFNTEEIVYGGKFHAITTSNYAFGTSGQSVASGVTEVLPYQPIYLYIEVEEYEE